MKKLYTLLFGLAIGTASYGQATLPHYEGFAYSGVLQTQPGWTLLNSGDDLVISAGSLSYPGLPASTGAKVAFGGSGIDASKEFTNQTANTVYFSILLNVADLSTATATTPGYSLGLIQGNTSNFGATVWIKRIDETNTFNIGINPRTTAANTVYSPAVYNAGTTYLIVASYTLVDGANNDIVNLWVNPTIGTTPPTPTATATNAGNDLTSVTRFLVRQGSATDTPNMEIDELRIATSWAEVFSATASIKNFDAIAGLKLYPNPLTGNVLNVTSNSNADKTVAIFDVLGKNVLNAKVTNETVNVSGLNSGVYIVKITEEGKTATRKLVVK